MISLLHDFVNIISYNIILKIIEYILSMYSILIKILKY